MKLLQISVEGLALFKETLNISFFAQQRVTDDDRETLYPLFSNLCLNPTNSFIGINASGKTSVLKLILMVLSMLNNEPINHIKCRDVLGNNKKVIINSYFYSENKNEVCWLKTVIETTVEEGGNVIYRISDESLWSKPKDKVKTRKALTDFSGKDPVLIRDYSEKFLPDDVSIMIAYNKESKEKVHVSNLLQFTNSNILPFSDNISTEIIRFLDPSIENLYFERVGTKSIIRLKFFDKKEITLNTPEQLNNYLSSGTIKGIIVFSQVKEVLLQGGYMIVDELENHFNKEIVFTLLRFFTDIELNRKGGTLLFSTHYPELLDEYDRNDSIYVVRNRKGITVDNLCSLLKRNDIKKSEAYQSGLLEGTTPVYEAYLQLKKNISSSIK